MGSLHWVLPVPDLGCGGLDCCAYSTSELQDSHGRASTSRVPCSDRQQDASPVNSALCGRVSCANHQRDISRGIRLPQHPWLSWLNPLHPAKAVPWPHVLPAHQKTCHLPVPRADEEKHIPPWSLKPPHDTCTRGCQEAGTTQKRTARVAM